MFFYPEKGLNQGERLAARFLKKQGYCLIAQNWRVKSGELDIIARDHEVLVFVEVKQRKTAAFGRPAEFVGKEKQYRVRRTAQLYLLENPYSGPVRFDVIEVLGEGRPEINHIRNAF